MNRKPVAVATMVGDVGDEMDSFLQPTIPTKQASNSQTGYPHWSPPSLIAYHLILKQSSGLFDHEQCIAASGLHGASLKHFTQLIYRKNEFLSPPDASDLYEALLSNERMKSVWAAILRRSTSRSDAINLAVTCNSILASWRGQPLLTAKETQDLFKSIANHAGKLAQLLPQAKALDNYTALTLIADTSIATVLRSLGAWPANDDDDDDVIIYVREQLANIMPSLSTILSDIQRNAATWGAQKPILKQPHAPNAKVHHFVRELTAYFNCKYKLPLPDHVATMACVALDIDDVTADAVRQLTK